MFSKLLVLVIAAILIFPHSVNAQLSQTDSLKKIVRNKTDKLEKLNAILVLCENFESLPPDTLYNYQTQAKQLAKQLNDENKIRECDYYYAMYLFKKNKLDSTLVLTNALLAKFNKGTDYNKLYVNLYVLKFNAYWRKNSFNDAIATSQELLQLAEEHNDTVGLIKARIDMGAAYHIVSNQPKEGLKWYYQALALLKSDALKSKYSSVYQNIAIAYDDLSIKDSTLRYLRAGLEYARLGNNLTNLARALRLYGSIMSDYKLFKEAEPAFREAIEVQKSIGDIFGTIKAMQGEADFYSNTSDIAKAISIYKDAIQLAEKNGMTQVMTYDLNQNLAAAYSKQGDFKSATEVLNKMLDIKDSNYKVNSAAALAEIQTKYDVQKKETLIAKQQLDLWQRKLFLYGGGILTALLLAFLLYWFKKYQRQQKLKVTAMMEEKKRQHDAAVKDAEERERKRIAAELHDNLGVQANAILHNSSLLNETASNNTQVITGLQETAKEMLLNLRETLWAMKTTDVAAIDLWFRIINFMKQMGRHYTQINFKIEGVAPENLIIASSRALHIVLVLQEAVNNSVKHAGATTITAASNYENSDWQIKITDDGCGFEPGVAQQKTDSYGLANMQQRASEGDFEYTIETATGNGTSILLHIRA